MKKTNKIIKNSIFILFIMLPIIDCIRRTPLKDVNILGISAIEILNIVIIGYTLILTIISLKNRKKELVPLIIYTILLGIYLLFHGINILKFDSSIYTQSNINIITETYYILRVYYLPVLLLFVLIKNKDIFDLKFYSKLIKSLICIISLSLILLNIFKLSYATYSATNETFVEYNIFDFYKSNEDPKLLSTRGWFDSSNEISAILMILLPINIYLLYKEDKKFNIFLYITQFLSMIILGTRVSSLGAILITITAILINIVAKIIKHNKINYKLIIYGILCTGYFFISPVGNHLLEYKIPNFQSEDEYSEHLKTLTDNEVITNYINENLYYFRINEAFVKMYPIEKDFEFWYDVTLRDRNLNNDSRIMKTTILKRIHERNNNKVDKLFGMGYTINFMDLERDYVYQYYLFGIFGIILIIPQILSLIKSGLAMLKSIKKNNIMHSLLIIMSPVLGFSVAYYSGHVFGWVSPSYILTLVVAILYCYIEHNKGSEANDKSKRNRTSV